ncbi:MAG: phytanoyl-CoA dioxygenase family protein [Pseudomonadota bacterium]
MFDKSPERNWMVGFHQDLSIPVASHSADPVLQGWSEKEGLLFVQPPAAILQQLVAVRVHLDDCHLGDGPLRVVPGSHRHGILDVDATSRLQQAHGEVSCTGPAGSLLVLSPLLLHASSKATGARRRRVLHFLWGPPTLTHGLRWQHAV